MARTSRRAAGKTEAAEIKGYKTGLYVRLSREDERKVESETVENQIEFLRDFISRDPSLVPVDEYVDRHFTGTKFDRPEFNRMIEDVRSGWVNCVVVKDLSRLGRNYLEAGDYIEKIFPFFGVRFIAVTDNYDSLTSDPTEDGLVVPLKNLINEAYAKDISKKICTSFENQFRQGIFLATHVAYGYMRDPDDTHMILVDEEVRGVVERIFDEYASGRGLAKIAKGLNADGVLAPNAYWLEKGIVHNRDGKSLWQDSIIKAMLKNPVYVGDVLIGKKRRCYYKGITKPVKCDGYYVRDHHEAVVSRETFDKVQEMLAEKSRKYRSSVGQFGDEKNNRPNLLKGLLYCGYCGNRLSLRRYTIKKDDGSIVHRSRYCCRRSSSYGDADQMKTINAEDIEETVLKLIQAQIALYLDAKERIRELNRKPASKGKRSEIERRITELEKRREKIETLVRNIYEDFADGAVSEDEYLDMKESYVTEHSALEKDISELRAAETYSESYAGDSGMADAFGKYAGSEPLSREMAEAFIKKITCYSRERIEVEYCFEDELDALRVLVEERGGEA